MAKKTLTLILDWFAEDNRLPVEEAKRLLRIILLRINQLKCHRRDIIEGKRRVKIDPRQSNRLS